MLAQVSYYDGTHLRDAQIGYFHDSRVIQQQIARLDVFVNDTLTMQILQALNELAEVPSRWEERKQ